MKTGHQLTELAEKLFHVHMLRHGRGEREEVGTFETLDGFGPDETAAAYAELVHARLMHHGRQGRDGDPGTFVLASAAFHVPPAHV